MCSSKVRSTCKPEAEIKEFLEKADFMVWGIQTQFAYEMQQDDGNVDEYPNKGDR